MISFLAALTIGVTSMVLYPFEHEPIFKDVKKIREEPTECWFNHTSGKVCFESKNKKEIINESII